MMSMIPTMKDTGRKPETIGKNGQTTHRVFQMIQDIRQNGYGKEVFQ